MEKILTQQEIDALFSASGQSRNAAEGTASGGAAQIELWSLQDEGRLRNDQLQSLSQVHEGFARNLTYSLGAYLCSRFEVALVSVEQLAYRDFLARIPEVNYYASFQLHPAECSGVLQLDLSLAFPSIDLLLGGQGQVKVPNREVTEIEDVLLRGVASIICRELGTVWQPLGVNPEFEQRQAAAQVRRIMPAQEKVLALSFEVTMSDSHGALNVVIPAMVSNALLRKLSTEPVFRRPGNAAIQHNNIRHLLLESAVELVLGTPPIPIKLSSLMSVRPGQILPLQRSIAEPCTLRLGGRDCWLARPVQSEKRRRAAQLVERLAQPEEWEDANGQANRHQV